MTNYPHPLGRSLEPNHDPRSLGYPAPTALSVVSAVHRLYGFPLNQLNLGSCTGNAVAHMRNCRPWHIPYTRLMTEAVAVKIYSGATKRDPWPGEYPPDDTGSDGMSAVKSAIALGLWPKGSVYSHAFGLEHALLALVKGPWVMGIPYYEDMFYPDAKGFITPGGDVAGGHELCANQIVVDASYPGGGYIQGPQSWGMWGPIGGFYRMTFKTLGRLLSEDGDVTTIH